MLTIHRRTFHHLHVLSVASRKKNEIEQTVPGMSLPLPLTFCFRLFRASWMEPIRPALPPEEVGIVGVSADTPGNMAPLLSRFSESLTFRKPLPPLARMDASKSSFPTGLGRGEAEPPGSGGGGGGEVRGTLLVGSGGGGGGGMSGPEFEGS